jgi:lysophospholipid acyltransferase (LPLAT)-like uncharacterized protein
VKLRKPWMIKAAAWFGVGVLRMWMRTIRIRSDSQGQLTEPWDRAVDKPLIYAFWHDSLLCIPRQRSRLPVTALISQSRDGELLTTIGKYYNMRTIRGSSTRGGIEAVNEAVAAAKRSHLLVAPDGPKGPAREIKRGLIYLASWTQLCIVPLGVGFSNHWRAGSWDRMYVPKPWSTITLVAGPVMSVPPDIHKVDTERYRVVLQENMLRASAAAQQWAETGRMPRIQWPARARAA